MSVIALAELVEEFFIIYRSLNGKKGRTWSSFITKKKALNRA